MAPQLQRSVTAQQEVLNTAGGARLSSWALPAKNNSVLEIQKYYNPAQWKRVPPNKQILVPPPHWHWHQTEYFDIKKGRFIFSLEVKEIDYDSTFGRITIPATARHTFRVDPTCETYAEIHINAIQSAQVSKISSSGICTAI